MKRETGARRTRVGSQLTACLDLEICLDLEVCLDLERLAGDPWIYSDLFSLLCNSQSSIALFHRFSIRS